MDLGLGVPRGFGEGLIGASQGHAQMLNPKNLNPPPSNLKNLKRYAPNTKPKPKTLNPGWLLKKRSTKSP